MIVDTSGYAPQHIYAAHLQLIEVIRDRCVRWGMIEFLPARDAPGYAHVPAQHLHARSARSQILLPYQQSVFNRVSTAILARETFCIGPCYRDEGVDDRHLLSFYQASFELYTDELGDLVNFVKTLLIQIEEVFDRPIGTPTIVDFRQGGARTDAQMLELATQTNRPVLITYKRRGMPPLLNMPHDDELEVALELVLPLTGEAVDGGVRDPKILKELYNLDAPIPTSGATIGLERMVAYLLGTSNIRNAQLR